MTRRWSSWAVALTLVVLATACTTLTGNDSLTITAAFSDIGDLVKQAHVRAGDVPIGTITGIDIGPTSDVECPPETDVCAVVTMKVDANTGLPDADSIEAVLSRTSLLGERFVDLRPTDGAAGVLADGATIGSTRQVTDIEGLVATGDVLLTAITVDNVVNTIQAGAEALGGEGQSLTTLIERLRNVIGQYNDNSGDLLRVIDAFDSFTATLAPDADLNAEGFTTLDETSRVLQRQDERLLDALNEIRRLAEVGGRILENNADEFDNSFRRLRILLEQINRQDNNVQDLITWVRRHNAHVANGVFAFDDGSVTIDHAQVWLDFIICGFPGGEEDGDPAADCEPPNLPGPGTPAERYPTTPECWDGDFAVCRANTDGHR